MSTQPNSIMDIEKLRAQLDAIYAPAEESVVFTESAQQPTTEKADYGGFEVKRLTNEAKSYSPNHLDAAKTERIATLGTYLDGLRSHKLGER